MTPRSQAERAYRLIKERLLSWEVKPGGRLVESDWAERINVNRADVRIAFARLRGEGLLSNGKKGGYFFPKVNQEDVDNILEVRLVLESGAIRLAVQRATDEELGGLMEIVGDMKKMVTKGYYLGFIAADLHFHEYLIDLAGNPKLKSLYEESNLPLTINLNQIRRETTKEMVCDVNDHKKIAEAVISRDANKAIRLLKKGFHMMN